MAVITGLFDSENYSWRSMTTPGITGLFNKNCMASAVENLMTCVPGDNSYDGVTTSVSFVSSESQFHSIYTTESTNGERFNYISIGREAVKGGGAGVGGKGCKIRFRF